MKRVLRLVKKTALLVAHSKKMSHYIQFNAQFVPKICYIRTFEGKLDKNCIGTSRRTGSSKNTFGKYFPIIFESYVFTTANCSSAGKT